MPTNKVVFFSKIAAHLSFCPVPLTRCLGVSEMSASNEHGKEETEVVNTGGMLTKRGWF